MLFIPRNRINSVDLLLNAQEEEEELTAPHFSAFRRRLSVGTGDMMLKIHLHPLLSNSPCHPLGGNLQGLIIKSQQFSFLLLLGDELLKCLLNARLQAPST